MRKIAHFMRVGHQVKQQRWQGGKVDVLPASSAQDGQLAFVRTELQRALGIENAPGAVAKVELHVRLLAPLGRCLALQKRQQGAPIALGWYVGTQPVEQGGHQVYRFSEGVDLAAARKVG